MGFPGEGPDASRLKAWWSHPPLDTLHAATLSSPGSKWRRWALGTLKGETPLHPDYSLNRLSTTDDIHLCLLALAEAGNSPAPIAARIQSRPRRLEALLGHDEITSVQARGGSAYNFLTRPFQHCRPRSIHLDKAQRAAVASEIRRLRLDCHAVEDAPPHDSDKALLSSDPDWEKDPLRTGPWPRERRIPVFHNRAQVQIYNRRCWQHQVSRRAKGLAFRDFESPVFTVPKKDGQFRLCTDYRKLNLFQRKTTFKMDDTQLIAETIQPGDYGMLVDLKDAYLTLGLHPSHRKYCRFRHPSTGQRLQWHTVSFGIAEAPRICTKLLRPLMAVLKQMGIRCIIYIDDILILHQDRLQLARSMAVAINLLQRQVGLNLKTSKCSFHPLQRFQCLGYVWDTTTMKTFVPDKRLKETHRTAKRLLRMVLAQGAAETAPPTLKTRVLACFVGRAVATFRGIRSARRHLIYLQHDLGQAVRRGGWNGMASLTPAAIDTLRWWASDAPWQHNGHTMIPEIRPMQVSVKSDAATETMGWGGTLQLPNMAPLATRGNFTITEQRLHINALELLGCWYTIKSLLPAAVPREQWNLVHLNCELDNTTAIKYARVAVSRSRRMSTIGAAFYDWVETSGLQLSYRHLRGIYNIEADSLSRHAWAEVEWQLNHDLLQRIQRIWQCLIHVDLFASRHNAQAILYYSWHHDFDAAGVDSLHHPWLWQATIYAYPPVFLITRLLQKVLHDSTFDLILIAPLWPSQSWWPTLMSLLTEIPLVLPHRPWITRDPSGTATWRHAWPLVAFRLSGDMLYVRSQRWKFRSKSYIQRAMRALSSDTIRNNNALVNSLLSTSTYT